MLVVQRQFIVLKHCILLTIISLENHALNSNVYALMSLNIINIKFRNIFNKEADCIPLSPKPIKILLIKIADIGKINLSNEILLTKEKYVFESRQKAAVNTEK